MPTEAAQVPIAVQLVLFVVLPLAFGCWAMNQALSEVDGRAQIAYAIIAIAATVGGIVGGFMLGHA